MPQNACRQRWSLPAAGMSADRTALTLDGQSRIQMLANGNEQKPLVLSLRDAEGQPVTGMKDQIKTELTFNWLEIL